MLRHVNKVNNINDLFLARSARVYKCCALKSSPIDRSPFTSNNPAPPALPSPRLLQRSFISAVLKQLEINPAQAELRIAELNGATVREVFDHQSVALVFPTRAPGVFVRLGLPNLFIGPPL